MNQQYRLVVEQENVIRDAISRASGTLIRNLELLYSTEYPFDIARKTVLDVLGDRGLMREITRIVDTYSQSRGGSK